MEILLSKGEVDLRDKIKNKQYFEEYIAQQENRILKFSDKLQKGEVREDRIFPVKTKIYDLKFSIFEAKYSKGEDLEILKEEFSKIVFNMPQYWNHVSGYTEILWMLSIAVMFEIDRKEWEILTDLIIKNNMDDWLLGYLLSSREKDCPYCHWKFKMENPYGYLKNIISHSRTQGNDLKDYLENKWYIAHNEMAWYEIHNNNEKLYSGYWSYESGAVAKILNIDDSMLRDVKYYPYDLVHYKIH